MNILFAGATGFLGSHLLPSIVDRGSVTVITRDPEKHSSKFAHSNRVKLLQGDLTQKGKWVEQISKQQWDIVINLVGENIFGRWNKTKKKKIYDSRIIATENLLEAISPRVDLLINASAIGIYGDGGDRIIAENSITGEDELAMIVEEWERVVEDHSNKFNRVVILRIGVVLGKEALMIKKMLLPIKFFLGGYPGNGKNYISWIHIDDFLSSVNFFIDNNYSGTFNITSPEPTTFKYFCKQLAKNLHRPCWLPIPITAIKIILGELGEYLTYSQRVLPRKLLETGFEFNFKTIDSALMDIFR